MAENITKKENSTEQSKVYVLFYTFFLLPLIITVFGVLFFVIVRFVTYESGDPYHYLNQIKQLDKSEKDLKKKITKFRQDEIDHKDIAYDEGATKKGPYLLLDKIIKTGSRIAINISEKI